MNGTRNLLYHIWPTTQTDNWRWNVQQLLKRIDLINGVRSIGVALDEKTVSLEEVKAEFGDTRIDNWIVRKNNPKMREGTTFLKLMDTLPHDDSVTFYAHAKGVRHGENSTPVTWAEIMYRVSLDNWPHVEALLEQFPIAGCFKRPCSYNKFGHHRWEYSGTFFWFRNRDTLTNPRSRHIDNQWFGCIEAWPGHVFKADEAGCIFGETAGHLYDAAEIGKQAAALMEWESKCCALK